MKVVAFGGGHGLSATLRALRRLPVDITAVVTVADDGGSSGRLRAERGTLPPGDLRQALAALADETSVAELFQYRFDGDDPLGGHPVGNLVLVGLLELSGDPLVALRTAGRLLRTHGRVLPMSGEPLRIAADVLGVDPAHPHVLTEVTGQHNLAVTPGKIRDLRLVPPDPAPAGEVLAAIAAADWLIFGPGSWFTSVIPHLLVPAIRRAIDSATARRIVALNLANEMETSDLSLAGHCAALARYAPGLRIDVVLADVKAVGNPEPVQRAAESLGAQLVIAPVAVADGSACHDPASLAAALESMMGIGRAEYDSR